jgi:hypothetical protein
VDEQDWRSAVTLQGETSLQESEAQQTQYLTERYLEHSSLEELVQRLKDIRRNMLMFSSAGIPSYDFSSNLRGLIERAAHVEHELELRQAKSSAIALASPEIFSPEYPRVKKAIRAWGDYSFPLSPYFVKYGKLAHLKELYDEGQILIHPASYYSDPSLTPAIRDEELEAVIALPVGTRLKMQVDNGEYREIPIAGRIFNRKRSETDFYIYCTAAKYDHRLFDDFESDACLLVHEPKDFVRRIVEACKENYSDWLFAEKMVCYYDPLRPNRIEDIPLSKHFRFWYQHEYRIVLKPKAPIKRLQPIKLSLGKVSNLCELIVL